MFARLLSWLQPAIVITGRDAATVGRHPVARERGVWLFLDLDDDLGNTPVGPLLARRLTREHAKVYGDLPMARSVRTERT
jgi:hypothetical protein